MSSKKIKVGIIGATGYGGAELLRLLLSHPEAEIVAISSVSFKDKQMCEVYPNFKEICEDILVDEDKAIEISDVVFAALPHGLCEPIAKKCLEKDVKFIDLGADFRLSDEDDYKKWYELSFKEIDLHKKAVYCIPELHRDELQGKEIVANPGCYPTSIALALAPIVKADLCKESIIIDSKSGATGAGRGLSLGTHFTECNEAFSAYKVASHRHTPEIEQTINELSSSEVKVTFVPHLLPINRGILSTIYVELKEDRTDKEIYDLYKHFYESEQFVRVLNLGENANLKYVKYSNYCDISIHKDERTNRLIICSVIDNMVKGAAGQAIQNMNLLFGIKENTGLCMIPPAF